MKKLLFLLNFLVTFILTGAFGQVGEWVWLHGSNTANSLGNFGTLGVPSPANEPPALYEPCEWVDLNGKFWLYGGNDQNGNVYAALWKYDPLTNEWTWMNGPNILNDPGVYGIMGVPSLTNRPPSRDGGSPSWVDQNGNLWMFGGYYQGGNNDLWKYDIAANEWTWMKGSNTPGQFGTYGIQGVPNAGNTPCARWECSSGWTDNAGDLWLFGGYNSSAIQINDLWRFNISTNTWTWMKGSNMPAQNGIYGTIGVEDSLNTPGARSSYSHWKDNNNNLWLFAGTYTVANSFNDLWRYNIVTNNWTWMSGSNAYNIGGFYGTKCNASVNKCPGKRFENRLVWTDTDGNFWLFGGGIYGGGGGFTDVWNDLWKYCVTSNQWVWVSGDSTSNPAGNWGTLGVSSPANQPKGRCGAIGWTDNNGHLYLFGGTFQGNPRTNDLWKYTIDTTCSQCASSVILPTANFILSDSAICSGDCINFTNMSQHSTTYQWIFPGGNPSMDTSANPHGICYFNSGTFDVTLIASNSSGSDTLSLPNFITIYPQIPFSALTQNGDTLFSIPGYASYEWFEGTTLINGANDFYYVATHSGNYSVVVTDANGCFASAQMLNVIASVNNFNADVNDFSAHYSSGNLILKINSSFVSSSDIDITDGIGKIIYQKRISVEKGKNEMEITGLNLSEGVYFIKLMNSKVIMTRKIFIQ